MRKMLLLSLLLSMATGLFAQTKMAAGFGPEWNMNARDNFAGGAAVGFEYNFGRAFAAGVNFTASSNFGGIAVLEPSAAFRWYFLSNEKRKEKSEKSGNAFSGLFVQADLGAYLVFEEGETTPMFLGGLRGGFRLPLGKMFYVEPFGRVGYPFMFGVGAMAGVRF